MAQSSLTDGEIKEELLKLGVKDIQSTDFIAGAVIDLVKSGLMTPDANGNFNPNVSVKVNEGVTLFAKVFGVAAKTDSPEQAIAKMEQAGLLPSGMSGDREMTRIEVARLVALANGVEPKEVTSAESYPWTDYDSTSPEDRGLLSAVYDLGVFKGFEDGSFRPYSVFARAEAAVVVDQIWYGTYNPYPTKVQLTTTDNIVTPNQMLTLTAKVGWGEPSISPTGTVTLMENATVVNKVNIDRIGNAYFYISNLSHGTHDLYVEYSGDNTFKASYSDPIHVIVDTVPIAQGVTYSVIAGSTLNVSAPGLLQQATDADQDRLTAKLNSTPQHGTVSIDDNGGFTYTPFADFHGSDSFSYVVNDGWRDSEPATVTLYLNNSLTYEGNGNTGGTAPIDSNTYSQGSTVTVAGNTGNLVKADYYFVGWNTKADGTGKSYAENDTFIMGSPNVTLYAQWSVFKHDPVTISVGTKIKPSIISYAGMLFAGWYTTPNSDLQSTRTAVLFNGTDTATTILAKYVDEGVLKVLAQVLSENGEQTLYDMRFISSVDSLNYSEVGFIFSLTDTAPEIGKENCVQKSSKTVYSSLNTTMGPYTIEDFKNNAGTTEPKYMFTVTMTQIPTGTNRIYVRPYYKTLDGTVIYGKTYFKTLTGESGQA